MVYKYKFICFNKMEIMLEFYIVPTPLGNPEDITLRAVRVLKEVDFVVCEHHKEYIRLVSKLEIPVKEWIECQRKDSESCLERLDELLAAGKTGALVSDCGSPVFEDPGFPVLRYVAGKNIKLVSLPGANSLMTALPLSPFEIRSFYFGGFISQKKGLREQDLRNLLKRKEWVILLETPYRLKNILELMQAFAPKRNIVLPFNLTLPDEVVYSGTAGEILKALARDNKEKGEFLLLIEGCR